MCFILGRIWC